MIWRQTLSSFDQFLNKVWPLQRSYNLDVSLTITRFPLIPTDHRSPSLLFFLFLLLSQIISPTTQGLCVTCAGPCIAFVSLLQTMTSRRLTLGRAIVEDSSNPNPKRIISKPAAFFFPLMKHQSCETSGNFVWPNWVRKTLLHQLEAFNGTICPLTCFLLFILLNPFKH